MLVFFLLQDDNHEKPYSDPADILPLLYGAMSPSSTIVPSVDVTPPSPTRKSSHSSGINPPDPITPPKPSATSATSLQVQDTPLVIKQSGTSPHKSLTDSKAQLRNSKLAREANGHFVGPVPAKEFIHDYVPKKAGLGDFPFDAEKAKMYEAQIRDAAKQNETKMYEPFKIMMDDILRSALESEKLQVTQTSAKPLTNFFGSDVKPDFVIHQGKLEEGGKAQLNNIELMIEVKADKGLDGFVDDNKDQVEGTTEQSEATVGQCTVYSSCHSSFQTRHTVFQVLIIEDYARLLRWDRSGAIVTNKIPLSDPDFFEFFWRFCHLGPEERGWDMMMGRPSPTEEEDARRELEPVEKELGIEGDVQYYSKISLGTGIYIAHRIFSGTQSPFGRGTRGYAAYSLTTKKVVFLKSTWRVVGEGRMPEHEIYEMLHANGVEHIPTVVEYAEVMNHVTKTQETPDNWRKKNVKRLRKFQHYLIVFNELCRKLEKFQSHKQLLTAFTHAADAHQQAVDKAYILHRDISAGNILITREGNGILGDWDMAKHLRDIGDGGPQPERTGTFQFLSARFVSDEYDFGPHDRKDDIESFFHTLQWIVLRFVGHGMHPVGLGETLYSIFDATSVGPEGLVRCRGRLTCLRDSIWGTCANLEAILRALLEDLRETINSRYASTKHIQKAQNAYKRYLNQLKQGTISEDTMAAAEQAILFNEFEKGGWLRERLKTAADAYGSDQPGDASTPQKYVHEPTHGAKKTTRSESNIKISALDYYPRSEEHVSKKLRLITGGPAHHLENPSETNDADDTNNDEPRTRKIPYGKRPETDGRGTSVVRV